MRFRSSVRRIRPRWLLAAGLFIAATAAAAYYDWMWWESYNAVLPLLAIAALLFLALAFVAARRSRPIALPVAVLALGIAAGHLFGPSRPVLIQRVGTVTVTLATPHATTGSAPVTCMNDEAGRELQVSGDPNLRLDIFPDNPAAPAEVDQREFVSVALTVGDRWRRGAPRDELAMVVSVGRVEVDMPETRMMAGPDSLLELDWAPDGGSARFARLAPEIRSGERQGEPVDLSGVIEWTCDRFEPPG